LTRFDRPRPDRVRIAAAQYPLDCFPALADYEAKLDRWVAEAAADGAELLVFPEYGAMEFAGAEPASLGDLKASLAAAARATVAMEARHAALARRHDIHILAASGPCLQLDGSFTNRAKLFAPSGVYGAQDKLIMTPFEVDWGISAGRSLRVFETALGTIGIAICYDSEFPLLVRAMTEAGADLILVPSCTEFMSGYQRVRTAAMARALENGCVMVQSPTIGDALWSPAVDRNSGIAGIFVPADRALCETGVLAEGAIDRSQWVTATVDMTRLRKIRITGEMRNSRDWALQPGATPLSARVERVRLT
jgi:predicted amidohydrolase